MIVKEPPFCVVVGTDIRRGLPLPIVGEGETSTALRIGRIERFIEEFLASDVRRRHDGGWVLLDTVKLARFAFRFTDDPNEAALNAADSIQDMHTWYSGEDESRQRHYGQTTRSVKLLLANGRIERSPAVGRIKLIRLRATEKYSDENIINHIKTAIANLEWASGESEATGLSTPEYIAALAAAVMRDRLLLWLPKDTRKAAAEGNGFDLVEAVAEHLSALSRRPVTVDAVRSEYIAWAQQGMKL